MNNNECSFIADCGTALKIGDKIQVSEGGRYVCGGNYSTFVIVKIIELDGCVVTIDTEKWHRHSISKLGSTNITNNGIRNIWFQGKWNSELKTRSFQGSVKIINNTN
jgi:hypothetical protein